MKGKGFVSCVKHSVNQDSARYAIVLSDIDGKELKTPKLAMFGSRVSLKEGEAVDFVAEDGVINTAEISTSAISGDIGRAAAIASSVTRVMSYATGIAGIDRITEKMWNRLSCAAETFVRKIVFGAPIIVRFHNDADGSSGAYGLYKAIRKVGEEFLHGDASNVMWQMHRGVVYSKEDSTSDSLAVNNFSSLERPLLFIIDFGTALESPPNAHGFM